MSLMSQFALPLLSKELIELAMRRRTYLVRVVYAAILLFACWLAFHVAMMNRSTRAIDYLGSGSLILWWLGYLQNIGLLLVVPATACDVFTREKERQTIGLLFMTRLSPWTIVWEKFLSRLIPAICLLWISLPLLGFSYSLGGVEVEHIANSAVGLITNAITLTAIAVACSALCQSTTAAFLWTNLLATVTPLMVVSAGSTGDPFDFILFGKFFSRTLGLNPPSAFNSFSGFLPAAGSSTGLLYFQMLAYCVPSLIFSAMYLVLARRFLVSRAFKKAFNPLRWLNAPVRFRSKLEHEVEKWRGDATRYDGRILPTDAPVAWRESQKRGLGRMQLWTRLSLSILVSHFIWLCLATSQPNSGIPRQLHLADMFSLSLWVGLLLLLITKSASLIAPERGQQTLPVLLTTPLAGADILRQKLAGIRSLLWMCLIPMGTSLVLRMLVAMPQVHRQTPGNYQPFDYPLAFLNELTMLAIYPHETIWLTLYFSLRSRTTIAAIMKSLFTIAGLCILPWIILMLFAVAYGGLTEDYFGLIVALLLIGPADLLLYGYSFDCIPPGSDQTLWPLALNSLLHGGLWWSLRRHCLNNADHLLGRSQQSNKGQLTTDN